MKPNEVVRHSQWTLLENSSGGVPINLVTTSHDQLTVAETGITNIYTAFEITPTPTFSSNTAFLPVSSFTATGTETETFWFHPDHLGSSNYITNYVGDVSQHMEYFAFGETFIEEHKNSHNSPYKFNGKELDEESGYTYYGARYLDMRYSIWTATDPLNGYNPIFEIEHYFDFEHNGGVLNSFNHNTYGYCYQSPIRYIDPNGKQVDVIMFDTTHQSKEKNESEKRLYSAGEKAPHVKNAFTVMAHGNPQNIRNVENGKKIEGEAGRIKDAESFDKKFNSYEEWNKGKLTKGFNLILYSCNTGKGKNSLGSRISKYYSKINVIAPSRQMWATSNNIVGIYGANEDGTLNRNDPGYWIVYQKGKAVEAYDATWIPGTSTEGHKVDINTIDKSHFDGETSKKDFKKEKK